ncbi:hypothetical protein R8Z50_10910 [Longispora sp. K20-0274]|uniref:hypothetical protein n=1 Tax=Longispora sp. K20-0274 TaxID=3088255 RepID=UPI00399BE835
MNHRIIRLSTIATTAMTTATSIHHVFRLGAGLVIPAVLLIGLPIALVALYRRRASRPALYVYLALTGLVVVWFGIIDGFSDHVLKAAGLDNVTMLPGGDAPIVATVYHLWSPAATTWFYESTGILTAVASAAATVLAIMLWRAHTNTSVERR